jgi:hypothetical protein
VSQSATSPAQPRTTGAPGRGVLRALLGRFVMMLLCYNVGIAGYLWYLAGRQEREVLALYRSSAVVRTASDSAAADLRRYQSVRRPLVDRLLPDGHHGTLILHDLGGPAGVAWTQTSTIGILAGSLSRPMDEMGALAGESVEIHERAHLVRAYHAELVGALMRATPMPQHDEYAATNRDEHFAEMAAQAYELVLQRTSRHFRLAPAVERLRAVEQRVPGTSGFVIYMLRQVHERDQPERAAMRAEATRLVGENAPLWEPIYAALEAQQRADGTMAPWPEVTPRHRLSQAIASLEDEGRRSTRLMALALTPGEWLLGVIE